MYGLQHDPDIKPWENPKELGIKLMTRQQKNELARKEGRAHLLRGQSELRLCDYDAAMRTFQLGCKADSRLGPEASKDLRQAWLAVKELCRGWRRAGHAPQKRKKAAFSAERQPVLADIQKFAEPADKALALRNLAAIHSKWDMHEEAVELLTAAIALTPNDQFLVHQRVKEHTGMGRYDLALPDALQVVRERPGWTEGLISLGMIEGQLGHWKEAAFHWHEALLLQPHNPHLRRDLERATVEMAPHEAAEFETLLKQRQTGDRYDSSYDGAVEIETYVENGREFHRPKGTGGRLEMEKLEALARQAERAATRSKFLERATIAAIPSAPPTGASLGAVHEEGDAAEGEVAEGEEEDAGVAEVTSMASQPELLHEYLATAHGEAPHKLPKTRVVGEEKELRSTAQSAVGAVSLPADAAGCPLSCALCESGDAKPRPSLLPARKASARAGTPSLVGRSVIIEGLLARPALNGSRGVCTSYNSETGRYNVQLPKGEVIALRPLNLATDAPATISTGGTDGKDSAMGGTRGLAAETDKDGWDRQKKTSIGARMAAKRNAKGISWASKGVNGMGAGISGSFASEEKRQSATEKAARRITEDFDWEAVEEAQRVAKMSPQEFELERKAILLKQMATDHMGGMDLGRAIKYLDDAIEMRPKMKELWSNRSYAYEALHMHEESLRDAEKAIELAPEWPKAYLRAARALMSLERGSEAAARLCKALEFAPRDQILLEAYKEARVLAECTRRTERAIRASQLPTFSGVGDEDITGIPRGACKAKGCRCNAYIQKHGRTTVLLHGRGKVRQDNDPTFFLCARCGHDCVTHKDLRDLGKERHAMPGGPADGKWTPPSSYTNISLGGARGGLDSSYYYAAVSRDKQVAPVDAPPKLDPRLVGSGLPEAPTSSRVRLGEESTDFDPKARSSSYYQAHHGRRTDYQVPADPRPLAPDGSVRSWQPSMPSGAASRSSRPQTDHDEWEDEADPSVLRDAVGPSAVSGKAPAGTDPFDPIDLLDPLTLLHHACATGGGDDGLLAADPLSRVATCGQLVSCGTSL